MTEQGSEKRSGPGRTVGAVLTVAVLVLVAVLVWLAVGGEDKDAQGSSASPTGTPTPATTGRGGTPLPTKSPGQTVPTETVAPPTARPRPVRVGLTQPADLRNGVTVAVTRIESVAGQGRGPGETSGPALRVSIEVTNDTADTLDLIAAVATLYYGPDRLPASDLGGPGVVRLPEELAAGRSVTGRFVFAVPRNAREEVVIHFGYDAQEPVAIFSGSAR